MREIRRRVLLPPGKGGGCALTPNTDYRASPARVILKALKRYGLIAADKGSSWSISGMTEPRWNDKDVNQMKTIPGNAFEAIYTGEIIADYSTWMIKTLSPQRSKERKGLFS
jgi:hypothetical protein